MRTRSLAVLLSLVVLLGSSHAYAQTDRSYHYKNINITATVNTDSTVRVDEKQTYQFVGAYHLGWRSIPHEKIDGITDVLVVDDVTGVPLTYSRSRHDNGDTNGFGKYTYFDENGATNIEWYYDLADTDHSWTISYTAHGAIGFYKDYDELYWNLFTDYDVPVDSVTATVILPTADTAPLSTFYSEPKKEFTLERPNLSTFVFKTEGVAPNAKLTVAVGWQKGVLDQKAYYKDALRFYSWYLAAIILLILSLVYAGVYELLYRRRVHGRGTIIAQYEPPEHLPPAEAEMLVKGKITDKGWSATLVDLAVRGYVLISEDKPKTGWFARLFSAKEYTVTPTQKEPINLREYEQQFLQALFDNRKTFSTALMKKSTSDKMYKAMHEVRKMLYVDIEKDTAGYEVGPVWHPSKYLKNIEKKRLTAVEILAVVGVFMGLPAMWIYLIVIGANNQGIVWFVISACASSIVVLYVRLIRLRLNAHGAIIKEEWLGFRLYLETAERYRLQKLTPELFEKFLPYAIVFGVEKPWGNAFKSISMSPPGWYSSGVHAGSFSSHAGMSSDFSAPAFSSAFSSSFASSFASAGGGGGGGSGGGGGAGGGGGGGGGGAA